MKYEAVEAVRTNIIDFLSLVFSELSTATSANT